MLDTENIKLVSDAHKSLEKMFKSQGKKLPENRGEKTQGLPLRVLDCAVINFLHNQRKDLVDQNKQLYNFDSVRAVFIEGKPIYKNSGFHNKSHIQICVRNPNCIKGYFRVLDYDDGFTIP